MIERFLETVIDWLFAPASLLVSPKELLHTRRSRILYLITLPITGPFLAAYALCFLVIAGVISFLWWLLYFLPMEGISRARLWVNAAEPEVPNEHEL